MKNLEIIKIIKISKIIILKDKKYLIRSNII